MNANANSVYAYGVKPLYVGPAWEHFELRDGGTILLCNPHGFLHYWIDEKLSYHECLKDTGRVPKLSWVRSSRCRVELHGPNNYTIHFQ